MSHSEKLESAFEAFDAYNAQDPNQGKHEGKAIPKELLYARRMTDRLNAFAPEAPEHVQLAIRCQHIGRWEIPRKEFEMNRKGYLQWRTQLKQHHAQLAESILVKCGYDSDTIERVKFLLLKKQLQKDEETKLLEDVVCLVFLEFYLDEFAGKHEDEKIVDILNKTMKKMSSRAIEEALKLPLSENTKRLLSQTA